MKETAKKVAKSKETAKAKPKKIAVKKLKTTANTKTASTTKRKFRKPEVDPSVIYCAYCDNTPETGGIF